MPPVREHAVVIRAFDYLAACAFGGAAAVGAWQLVPDGVGAVPGMLLGMLVGVVAVVPVLLVLSSILGGFELIVLSMQVGMLAGMTGSMTSSAQWLGVAGEGSIVGLLVQILLHAVDRSLSGEVQRD